MSERRTQAPPTLAKIGKDENSVSLHKEAQKKGGVLSMEDLMKMHGV